MPGSSASRGRRPGRRRAAGGNARVPRMTSFLASAAARPTARPTAKSGEPDDAEMDEPWPIAPCRHRGLGCLGGRDHRRLQPLRQSAALEPRRRAVLRGGLRLAARRGRHRASSSPSQRPGPPPPHTVEQMVDTIGSDGGRARHGARMGIDASASPSWLAAVATSGSISSAWPMKTRRWASCRNAPPCVAEFTEPAARRPVRRPRPAPAGTSLARVPRLRAAAGRP